MIQISEGGAAGMCVEVTFFLFEGGGKEHDTTSADVYVDLSETNRSIKA